MRTENLLIEIGTEELPPKSLRKLAEAFALNVQSKLEEAQLSFKNLTWLASPRRLAVKVDELQYKQEDRAVEKRGPSVQAAFDADGNATKAAQGWARSNGITPEQADRIKTDKGEWLLFKSIQPGLEVSSLLNDIVNTAINKLPIPKPMRWGDQSTQFIRPVHTVTILLGDEVVEAEVLGIRSSNIIRGHRFHGSQEVMIDHADSYETILQKEYVVADFNKRKELIASQVQKLAAQFEAVVEDDNDLLEEVTGLVEWPIALSASFEESFLEVPKEALIYTMKDDQKYFPMLDKNGRLLPRFIFITNIESKDEQVIIKGNEKVVRPRLADAQFFFNTDRKKTLEQHAESLSKIVFQKQLGTVAEKSGRVSELAGFIATIINADVSDSQRAGLLSKADLVTSMVYEFPDVQGVMGMHYARHDGENEDVALALNEQYMPRYSGDQLPSSLVSCAVSLAEKFDSLVGIFGIGQIPKGDKDPFALRRASIGIIRILVEKSLTLDITKVIEKAVQLYQDKLSNNQTDTNVFEFILNRYKAFYQDKGVSSQIIASVMNLAPVDPMDFDKRIDAVVHFASMEESDVLAAANKRVSNILAKQESEISINVEEALLEQSEEKALYMQLTALEVSLAPLFDVKDYKQALVKLAVLKSSVDSFFDNVMVMADDEKLRMNRLAMLSRLRQLFLKVADISELN